MSEREDYEGLADELGDHADRLEQQSERLEDEIGDVREDWERKRSDPGVPGAPPRQQASGRDAPHPEDAEREGGSEPETEERAGSPDGDQD